MWVGDPKNHASTVFHEMVYVAFSVCQLRGMAEDEELIAYLPGWLKINIIDEIYNDDNPQIK